jgi:DNA-binding transcriptional regulator YdaS (Cro superfamily)
MNKGMERAITVFGSQAAMAEALEVSQPTISEWLRSAKRKVPAERCPQIEGETARLGQRVYCEELRDDVPWGVLRSGCCKNGAASGGGGGGAVGGGHEAGGNGHRNGRGAPHNGGAGLAEVGSWPPCVERERRLAPRRARGRRQQDGAAGGSEARP